MTAADRAKVTALRTKLVKAAARCVAACLRYEASGRALDETDGDAVWIENGRAENEVDRAGKAYRVTASALLKLTTPQRKARRS